MQAYKKGCGCADCNSAAERARRWQRVRARAQATLRAAGDWDESLHPRDEDGKFAGGGGGSSSGDGGGSSKPSGGGGKHPGKGYSKDAFIKNGVIHTKNVDDAARALHENKKVELDQPRSASVLIDKLGAITKSMIAAGKEAPIYNLCNVSISGTNLFCTESKGIPRIKMPQLDDEQTKEFRKYLDKKGYKVEKEKTLAVNLRATQNELNGAKTAAFAEKLRDKPDHYAKRIIVSKDDYILDGHHHWAAKIGLDAEDNDLSDDTEIKIARVNISITKLLEEAETFTGGKGKQGLTKTAATKVVAAFVIESLFAASSLSEAVRQ